MAVRRERVILELEDQFTTRTARAAAAAALLNRELNSLSGSATRTSSSSRTIQRDMDGVARSANKADSSINQLTGRLRVMAETAAVLSPALAPIGGVGVAGVAGLAQQLGVAAIAGGVLIGSMQGLGDALSALNDAALEPSNENLAKAEDALNRLSPAAAEFAREAYALAPALRAIRDMGAQRLFPGLTDSLDDLERLAPTVALIFRNVGDALGDIAAGGAESLASERWADFFEFIATEAPVAITELAATVGDLTHGMAELWMAFAPLNADTSAWMMDVAAGFDAWATGLSQTDGFIEFITYIRDTGPQVAETFGALGNAILQIVQASAPLGGPVLRALESVADVVAAIADSDLGTPIMAGVVALSLLNRTLAVTAALSKVSLSTGLFAGLGTASKGIKGQAGSIRADIAALSSGMVAFGHDTEKAGKAADRMKRRLAGGLGLAGLAVAATGAADAIGMTNTASLALLGSMAGPWGAAAGAAAGVTMDLMAANNGLETAIRGVDAAIEANDLDALTAQMSALNTEMNRQVGITAGLKTTLPGLGWAYGLIEDASGDGADAQERGAEAAKKMAAEQEKSETQARRAAIAYARNVGLNLDVANTAEQSAEKIKEQAKAFQQTKEAARESARATAASFGKVGDTMDDATVSLSGWLAEMEKTARALANFNDNSLKAAKRGLDKGLIASLREAGQEGARRMDQLANGTEAGIKRANAAYKTLQRETKRTEQVTLDLMGLSPIKMRVNAETEKARSDINALEARLRNIADEDVFINVRHREYGRNTMGPVDRANGGPVYGPGTSTSDSIPARLSDGEYVIRAAAVQKYGTHMFDSLNAMRFADGGKVDKKKPRPLQSGYGVLPSGFKGETVRDLNQFIRQQGKALEAQVDAARALQTAASDQQQAAQSAYDAAVAQRDAAGQAAVAGFNTGLFDRDSNVWAAGAGGGPFANLSRDIAGLTERQGLVGQLSAQGLTGTALASLLAEGNNAQIGAMIANGQIGQYASLFGQREALQGSVAAAAGEAAFGEKVAVMADRLATANTHLAQATAHAERMEVKTERAIALLERQAEDFADAVKQSGNSVARRGRRDRG